MKLEEKLKRKYLMSVGVNSSSLSIVSIGRPICRCRCGMLTPMPSMSHAFLHLRHMALFASAMFVIVAVS